MNESRKEAKRKDDACIKAPSLLLSHRSLFSISLSPSLTERCIIKTRERKGRAGLFTLLLLFFDDSSDRGVLSGLLTHFRLTLEHSQQACFHFKAYVYSIVRFYPLKLTVYATFSDPARKHFRTPTERSSSLLTALTSLLPLSEPNMFFSRNSTLARILTPYLTSSHIFSHSHSDLFS